MSETFGKQNLHLKKNLCTVARTCYYYNLDALLSTLCFRKSLHFHGPELVKFEHFYTPQPRHDRWGNLLFFFLIQFLPVGNFGDSRGKQDLRHLFCPNEFWGKKISEKIFEPGEKILLFGKTIVRWVLFFKKFNWNRIWYHTCVFKKVCKRLLGNVFRNG